MGNKPTWGIKNYLKDYISKYGRSNTSSGKIYTKVAYATGSPSGDVTTIASSGTANTFGSWTEVEDSLSADSLVFCCTVCPAADVNYSVIELGTGAQSSESTFARIPMFTGTAANVGVLIYTFPIPIKIAAGTRIAARATDNEATENNYYIYLMWYQGLET